MRTLVLFDFDGTLTRSDSMWSFLRFCSGTGRFSVNLLIASPWLLLYALRIISTEQAKKKLLSVFLKGKTEQELDSLALDFTAQTLPEIMNPEIAGKLNAHKTSGDHICIVTASASLWIRPFANENGVDFIATELDFTNGVFNGNFKTPNCKGPEKVNRIKARFDLSAYSKIVAYGNSGPDDEMFSLADVKHQV